MDFSLLNSGEVHTLPMGENGAGKSTLIKVLTGVYAKDGGAIELDGTTISPRSTLEAQSLGISTVYQEVNLIPTLTVAENIFLGREPKKFGNIDWKAVRQGAEKALSQLDVKIDVTKLLSSYSIAIQQMVAIARAVQVDAKVLVLDEPTSSLDSDEVARLFAVIRKLEIRWPRIVFVSHFLDQVFEISDRITVLRNGKLVGAYVAKDLTRFQLDLQDDRKGRIGCRRDVEITTSGSPSLTQDCRAVPECPGNWKERNSSRTTRHLKSAEAKS